MLDQFMLLPPGLIEGAVGAFVTLFVIVDPIGLAPLFVALTAGASPAQRRAIAVGAVAVAFGFLMAFGLFGEAVLEALGIGLPAFRISGGLMLFLIALEMLFEKRTERRSKTANDSAAMRLETDPTVFPLGTPLLAGPGAIATIILLTAETETVAAEAAIYACLALVLLTCLALFLAAGVLERLLGPTGVNLTTRLFGVLLGALAVQFVLDGLADFTLTHIDQD